VAAIINKKQKQNWALVTTKKERRKRKKWKRRELPWFAFVIDITPALSPCDTQYQFLIKTVLSKISGVARAA